MADLPYPCTHHGDGGDHGPPPRRHPGNLRSPFFLLFFLIHRIKIETCTCLEILLQGSINIARFCWGFMFFGLAKLDRSGDGVGGAS